MKIAKILSIPFSLLVCAVSAWALDLDQAKSQGLVGEQQNGYLGVVNAGKPEVAGLVARINEERKAKYVQIAAKNGTPIGVVEALAGKKAVAETPAGRYVQDSGGGWRKK